MLSWVLWIMFAYLRNVPLLLKTLEPRADTVDWLFICWQKHCRKFPSKLILFSFPWKCFPKMTFFHVMNDYFGMVPRNSPSFPRIHCSIFSISPFDTYKFYLRNLSINRKQNSYCIFNTGWSQCKNAFLTANSLKLKTHKIQKAGHRMTNICHIFVLQWFRINGLKHDTYLCVSQFCICQSICVNHQKLSIYYMAFYMKI